MGPEEPIFIAKEIKINNGNKITNPRNEEEKSKILFTMTFSFLLR